MKNNSNNSISYKALFSLTLILMFICFFTVYLKNASKTDDYQPLTISKLVQGPSAISLIKGNVYKTSFKAASNNLGIVTFRFDTSNYQEKDYLLFQIKEQSSNKWYYSNPYRTDWFQNKMLYPFGFPVISNSKNKVYDIQLSSLNGNKNNYLMLDSSQFITKYSYSRSDIRSLTKVYPIFLEKIRSVFDNISLYDAILIFSPLIATIFIVLFCKSFAYVISYQWVSLLADIRKAIAFKRILKWGRVYELAFVLLYINVVWASIVFIKNANIIFKILICVPLLFLCIFLSKVILKYVNKLYLHKGLIAVLVIYVGIKALFIQTQPIWDGMVYFKEIQRSFDLIRPILINFGTAFTQFGHPSQGYVSFLAIGRAIFGDNYASVHISNTLLGVATLMALYGLIRKIYRLSTTSSALYTLLFAVNPLFIATSISLNMDYPVVCFFTLALFFLLEDKLIISTFFWILLAFSKETGLLLYMLFVGAELGTFFIGKSLVAKTYFERLKLQKKHLAFIISGYGVYICIPVILFIFNYFMSSSRLWQPNYYTLPHTPIVLNAEIISMRFAEIFVLNFQWILLLVVIFSFIKLKRLVAPVSIVLTTLLFSLIFSLYNSSYPPRYIIHLQLLFFLIVIPHIEYIFKNKRIKYIFFIIFSLLLLIQNFLTIDIISMKIFSTFKWGNYSFIKIGNSEHSRSDTMVYNSQYAYVPLLYKQLHQVLGNSSYSLIVNNLETNKKSGKWAQQYRYAPYFEVAELKNISPKGQLYYVFLPWLTNNKDEGIAEVKKYYSVGESNIVEINRYWLRYYKLTKLNTK